MGRSHHQNPAQRQNGKPQTAHATQPERLCSHVTPLSLHVLFGENIGQVWHCGFPSEHCGFHSETSCTSLSVSYKNETSAEEAPRSLQSGDGLHTSSKHKSKSLFNHALSTFQNSLLCSQRVEGHFRTLETCAPFIPNCGEKFAVQKNENSEYGNSVKWEVEKPLQLFHGKMGIR